MTKTHHPSRTLGLLLFFAATNAFAGSAGSCVRQTLVGAVNIWEYTNTCDRTVQARITRRCDASDSATAGKKKSIALMFAPRQTIKFDRAKHFGGFCTTLAGNTNSEYVESQDFR
jgi:hypothetical protein